jgi:hypothetical protein
MPTRVNGPRLKPQLKVTFETYKFSRENAFKVKKEI